MPKYGFMVSEKLEFRREIILETDLDEDSFLDLTERAERISDSVEDFAFRLEKSGVKVVKMPDSDTNSPDSMEIEYWDHMELEEKPTDGNQ